MAAEQFDALDGGGLPEFLQDPRGVLRRRWRWMLSGLLVGLLGTGLYAALWEPTYIAKASMMVSSQQIPKEFVRPTVEKDSVAEINAMMGEALTQKKLHEIIQKYDLFPELSGKEELMEAVTRLRRGIRFAPARQPGASPMDSSRVYGVSFEATDAKVAAIVANEVVAQFIDANHRTRQQQAELATEFLRREREDANAELVAQNRELREYKERYRGQLPEELTQNLHKLERLQSRSESLSRQITDAESRLATYLASPDESSPEAQLEGLRVRLAQEIAVHTEEHPQVKSLRRQVVSLEAQIVGGSDLPESAAPSRTVMVEATQRELATLRLELAEVEQEATDLDQAVAQTPARQEELAVMEQRARVLQSSYQEFLHKVQDAELAADLELAQQGARIVVLDRATPPLKPEGSLLKYIAAGVVASFGLALAAGIGMEFLDPVALSSGQVESLMGMPILGSVSRIS